MDGLFNAETQRGFQVAERGNLRVSAAISAALR